MRYNAISTWKCKTINHPVKNSVNSTADTTLFSKEKVGGRITQSKLVLTVLLFSRIVVKLRTTQSKKR